MWALFFILIILFIVCIEEVGFYNFFCSVIQGFNGVFSTIFDDPIFFALFIFGLISLIFDIMLKIFCVIDSDK